MTIRCKYCKHSVTARFHHGSYHFQHCGRKQSVAARDLGHRKTNSNGTAVGAAVGLLSALGTAINPLGALFVGGLVGSAFNGDNSVRCHKSGCGHPAYPTGRKGGQGDPMYQCSNRSCRAYTFRRSK